MIKYSVIVCTYNGSKTISDCLEALSSQNISRDEYEVIIINDGSTDNTQKIVENKIKKYQNFKLINKNHAGLSVARNIGYEQAEGKIVLYTDDDAAPDKDWIHRITKEYEDDTAGVGGYPRPFKNDVYSLYEYGNCLLTYGIHAENIDGAGGMNMSFRKKVLEDIGGFDPIFTSVGDDADLNERLVNQGYKLKVISDITVRHRCPSSIKSFCKKKFKRGIGDLLYYNKRNNRYLFFKAIFGIYSFLIPTWFVRGIMSAKIFGRLDLSIQFIVLAFLEQFMWRSGLLYYYLKNNREWK